MCAKEGDSISRLYTAWFDNGQEIEDPYNYEYTPGRHVIYPGKFVSLPDYWDVSFEAWWLNDDISQLTESKTEGKNLCYLQTLKGTSAGRMAYTTFAPDGKSTLRVPYGIQMIQAGLGGIAADTLVVPSSVLRIDGTAPTMQVRDAYQVASDNRVYASTKDGILTTKDGSRYCGIPTKMTSLDVPEKVAKVDLPAVNSLSCIILHANTVDELPKLNLENLDDCTIVVNDGVFEDFVARRYYQLVDTDLTVAKASEPDVKYHVSNGMIYSETDLVNVMDAGQSSIELKVPHTIKTGAFDSCYDVDTIMLGDDRNYVFEDGCLNEAVSLIVCKTKEQYDYVSSRVVDAGAPYASVALSQSNKSGFVWYTYTTPFGDENTTLEKAPADLVEFDGCVVPDDDPDGCLWIDTIGSSAFSDCQSLRWVTLPESVERIGSSAFAGCKNLEGVLINTSDTIIGEAYAFRNCSNLRFIASNAHTGYFVTDERADNCVMYAPTGCEGYDWRFVEFDEASNVTGFTMVDIGGGAKALYGVGDTWLGTVPWIALGSSSSLPAKVELPDTTMQLFSGSFSHISTPFEVNWEDLSNLQAVSSYQYFSGATPAQSFMYAGAFQYSNLMGEVRLGVPDVFGYQSGNFVVGESAFGGCNISRLSVESSSAQLYAAAFEDCTKLSSVIFESNYGDVYANAFFGCISLADVTFNGFEPMTLATYKSGEGYEFKLLGMDTPQDEAEQLHFHVPEGREDAYIGQWAYRYAGYLDYDDMFSDTQMSLLFETGSTPSDAEVVSVMAKKLTVAENTLRKMMGLDLVETTTVVSADTETGSVFKKIDGVNTLVSVSSDKTVIDLGEVIPDSMNDVQVTTNAFENCPNLKRVISSSKVSGLDAGVFSGLESVTFEVPSLDAAPMLLQGSADMPYIFGFGTQLSLDIPESIRDVLLRDWTYQAYGIMEEYGSPFFSSSMNNFILWYCYDWNPETTQADLDNKANSQFAAFENQLRIALGLDEVADYTKLASYVSTIDYFDVANPFGTFGASSDKPVSVGAEAFVEGEPAEAWACDGRVANDDSGNNEASLARDANSETAATGGADAEAEIGPAEELESALHQE